MIKNECCLTTMAQMPDNYIDLTITSPPYDNMRTYNNNAIHWGQQQWQPIIKELYRTTKIGGVVVWIVNDATIKGSETGTSFKQALYAIEVGFNLHDTMIYSRFGRNPDQIRYRNDFEYMFIWTKGKPKTITKILDRPNKKNGILNASKRDKNGKITKSKSNRNKYGDRGNIWHYSQGYNVSTKDTIAYQHPAIFPEELVADHIKTWSKEGELVYDPFAGSGTTLKVAHQLNRRWIGSEINPEYCQIISQRMQPVLTQLNIYT